MRHLLVSLCLLPPPAFAQDLTEVEAVPPSVMAAVDAAADADQIVDRVRLWQGDVTGDARPDLLVQAAYAFAGGGNAVVLRHWVFAAVGPEYMVAQTLDLPDGIKAARRDGADLAVKVYEYLPEDARCCPSGEAEVRVPLD